LIFFSLGCELSVEKVGAELPQTQHKRELQLWNTPEAVYSLGPDWKPTDPSSGERKTHIIPLS